MLYDLNGSQPNREPHSSDFCVWRSRISDADYEAMVAAITAYCDRHGEWFCSSWMPGNDSAIRAAFPALVAACAGSEEQSGLLFGNIVWRVLYDRNDHWYFKPANKKGGDPLGMTYWRKTECRSETAAADA